MNEGLYQCAIVGAGVLVNNFEGMDNILTEYCNTIKLFHERVVLPCIPFDGLSMKLFTIYENLGNATLARLLDLQNAARELTSSCD